MTEQQPLFDPQTVAPKKCLARGCPGVKNLCIHAADVSEGIRDPWAPKPKTCLLRHDPADGTIPF